MKITLLEGRQPAVALVFAALFLLAAGLSSGRAGEFKLGERTLRAQAGFRVEPVAGPPLLDRPIT